MENFLSVVEDQDIARWRLGGDDAWILWHVPIGNQSKYYEEIKSLIGIYLVGTVGTVPIYCT